ncbi:Hemin transport protein [Pseudoxanthomonas kalamensis]|uniref:Hemin transport protein n=1 Tax=Pseudoxanthomonas kalamensis TaxID=289483 RepID=UPI001FE76BFF|nr:Hemin transport protein [Pseudoxanthomonas kalamensis]
MAQALPHPQQLAALGTVLCLYRPQHGSELSGWTQAVRTQVQAGVDSDGLRESLSFYDAQGACCWRLCLLPDSDFLAWDRLLASLPAAAEPPAVCRVDERLWRRLARRLLGESWRATPLQLHAMSRYGALPTLAASPVPVSALGAATAQAIVRAEGAEGECRVDDCCCARSALLAEAAFSTNNPIAGPAAAMPLVRLG